MIRVGRGKNAITLEGLDAQEIEKELNDAIGPVLKTMNEVAENIIEKTKMNWPIKTGKSKEGFYKITTFEGEGTKIEISILNKEAYVPYIKSTKVGKEMDVVRNRSPLAEMRKLTASSRKELAMELKRSLTEQLSKQFNK
jgi:hypothetical protein